MMKKFSSYFHMAALAAVVCLSGCGNDEEDPKPAPTVKFVPGETTVTPAVGADVYEVSVSYHADEKIKSISVFVSNGTNKEDFADVMTKDFNSATDHTVIYELEVPSTGFFEYEFQIVDKNEKTVSKKLKINAAASEISNYAAQLMGGQKATAGSFFSSSEGKVKSQTEAKASAATIDFLYYFGAKNAATIAAPGDTESQEVFSGITSWTAKNATSLMKTSITASQFDAITTGELLTAAASSISGTAATQLSLGDVLAFKTVQNKIGLIKVTNITVGEDGSIKIDVKVQK